MLYLNKSINTEENGLVHFGKSGCVKDNSHDDSLTMRKLVLWCSGQVKHNWPAKLQELEDWKFK